MKKKQILIISVMALTIACSRPASVGNRQGELQAEPEHKDTIAMNSKLEHQLFVTYSDILDDREQWLHFYNQRDVVTRFREVHLHEGVRTDAFFEKGDVLVMTLFEKQPLRLFIDRVSVNIHGTVTIRAVLKEGEHFLILSTTDRRSSGNLLKASEDKFYQVVSDPEADRHYLIEMRASDRDILEGGGPLLPPD